MRRAPSLSVMRRNEPLLAKIKNLKGEHPFWGYRRIWAHLTYVDKILVNKKRIYRLMKSHGLLVNCNTHLKAKRTSTRSKPRADRPNQFWGIDMTKLKTAEGWSYLVVVLDWYSKKIVGHHVALLSRTTEWLEALEKGVKSQFPNGSRGGNLKLISDNGCQPTSLKFMKACNLLGIEQIFTSYNNPKGNGDTERMMRTLKEELIWIKEWDGHHQVEEALSHWIASYNESYLHSAHGYRSPVWAEKNYGRQIAA